jgi:release factor glutamine methyltransferase
MVRRLFADDSNGGMTFAWPVEVREVDALPGTEYELAIAHRETHIVPCQHGFDVRVGISLGVMEVLVERHELSELRDQVALHIGVGILVHEDTSGCMEHPDDAQAVFDLRTRDRRAHASRDVDRCDLCLGRDLKTFVVKQPASLLVRQSADGRQSPPADGAGRDNIAVPTWGQARAAAIERLRTAADPGTATLDVDVLLAFALDTKKEQVLAHPERALSVDQDARFGALIGRRHQGEPVAYLRGWKEFYGLRFRVDPRVLIPRPETETLVDEARRFIATVPGVRQITVVDVGTGSGAIGCAIAVHEPRARVIATDASRDALAVAEANALSLGVADRVDIREGDLLAPVTGQVDVVCANLPYLREDAVAELTGGRTSLAFEPRTAVVAGTDGLDMIRRAAADLPRVLAPGGAAFFECDPPQSDAVAELLRPLGDTRIIADLAGMARVVSLTRK